MRKWVSIALAVVVLGLLSVSYYIAGERAEKEFNSFLESINKTTPNIQVSADHYHRGWLKSTVHLRVIAQTPPPVLPTDLPAQTATFSFNADIYHGPIIISSHKIAFGLGYVHAKVPLPDEVLHQFNDLFTDKSTQPEFIFSLLLKYQGRLNVDFHVPAFQLIMKDHVTQLDWKGLTSYWKISDHFSHMQGDFTFKGATYKDPHAHGTIEAAHIQYDIKNAKNILMAGTASVQLNDFQWLLDNHVLWAIGGFDGSSKSHVNNGEIDSSLKIDVNKVIYHDIPYGPGIINVTLKHIDAAIANQIQQQLQAASSDNLTPPQQQVLIFGLLSELPQLLSHGLEFDVKQLQLSIPQGLIFARAKVELPAQQGTPTNPLTLINQLTVKAHAEVPVAWLTEMVNEYLRVKIQQHQALLQQLAATPDQNTTDKPLEYKALTTQEIDTMAREQTAAELGTWVQNGLLIQKENSYNIKVFFHNGSLMVNNKPFNSNMLQESAK